MFFIKLWTIKDEKAYEELKNNKILYGKTRYVDNYFKNPYDWIIGQMKERLQYPSLDIFQYPVWAWYKWGVDKKNTEDLRYRGYGQKGAKLYKIEFEESEEKILLSDFCLFNFVLNYWYLPKNENDDIEFRKEIKNSGTDLSYLMKFDQHSKELDKIRHKIEESWNLIFDLKYNNEYINPSNKYRLIQATLWNIKWNQVTKVQEIIVK